MPWRQDPLLVALGRPRSVQTRATLNAVSCNYGSKMSNGLGYKGQWPPSSIPAERIPSCILDANLVILAEIHYKLSHGQTKFLRIWVKMAKMTLKVNVNDPIFNTSQEYPKFGANLAIPAQICDELSCGQGKVYRQIDWLTGRRTDAGNHGQRQYRFGKKVKGYKSGVKRLNTLGHLDQYMAQHGRIVKQSYCETV